MRASALKFLPWRVAFRVEEGEAVGAVGAGLGGGETKEGEGGGGGWELRRETWLS